MMEGTQDKGNRRQFWEGFIIGLILIATGLFTLSNLMLAFSPLATVLGISAILAGGIYAGLYIQGMVTGDSEHTSWISKAVMPLVFGLLLLIEPPETMKYLVIAAGLYFIVNAIFMSIAALVRRPLSIRMFWFTFSIALLILIAGLLIVLAPTRLGIPVEAVIGTGLILNGLLHLLRAAGGMMERRKHKKEIPSSVERDEVPQ